MTAQTMLNYSYLLTQSTLMNPAITYNKLREVTYNKNKGKTCYTTKITW
uniref:Uncharacterized protein n=1 Tax=Arundo donax TaxID=35708 RepID=A0A0A9H855_ARUDO